MTNIKGNKLIILSAHEKEKIVKSHFEQEITFLELAKKYKISYSSVRKWCLNYEI